MAVNGSFLRSLIVYVLESLKWSLTFSVNLNPNIIR